MSMEQSSSQESCAFLLLSNNLDSFNNELDEMSHFVEQISLSQSFHYKKLLQSKKIRKNRRKVVFHCKKRRKNNKQEPPQQNLTFTNEEDQKLMNLIYQYGPKFNFLIQFFENRNVNALKNRYYKHLRYNNDFQPQDVTESENHIQENEKNGSFNSLTNLLQEANFSPEVSSILGSFLHKLSENFK